MSESKVDILKLLTNIKVIKKSNEESNLSPLPVSNELAPPPVSVDSSKKNESHEHLSEGKLQPPQSSKIELKSKRDLRPSTEQTTQIFVTANHPTAPKDHEQSSSSSNKTNVKKFDKADHKRSNIRKKEKPSEKKPQYDTQLSEVGHKQLQDETQSPGTLSKADLVPLSSTLALPKASSLPPEVIMPKFLGTSEVSATESDVRTHLNFGLFFGSDSATSPTTTSSIDLKENISNQDNLADVSVDLYSSKHPDSQSAVSEQLTISSPAVDKQINEPVDDLKPVEALNLPATTSNADVEIVSSVSAPLLGQTQQIQSSMGPMPHFPAGMYPYPPYLPQYMLPYLSPNPNPQHLLPRSGISTDSIDHKKQAQTNSGVDDPRIYYDNLPPPPHMMGPYGPYPHPPFHPHMFPGLPGFAYGGPHMAMPIPPYGPMIPQPGWDPRMLYPPIPYPPPTQPPSQPQSQPMLPAQQQLSKSTQSTEALEEVKPSPLQKANIQNALSAITKLDFEASVRPVKPPLFERGASLDNKVVSKDSINAPTNIDSLKTSAEPSIPPPGLEPQSSLLKTLGGSQSNQSTFRIETKLFGDSSFGSSQSARGPLVPLVGPSATAMDSDSILGRSVFSFSSPVSRNVSQPIVSQPYEGNVTGLYPNLSNNETTLAATNSATAPPGFSASRNYDDITGSFAGQPTLGVPSGAQLPFMEDSLNQLRLSNPHETGGNFDGTHGYTSITSKLLDSLAHAQREHMQRQALTPPEPPGLATDIESTITEERTVEESVPTSEVHTASKSPTKEFVRLVRNQVASLDVLLPVKDGNKVNNLRLRSVALQLMKSEGFTVRPSDQMTVEWRLPMNLFHTIRGNSDVNLSIALVRYGSPFNSPNIIAKSISPFNKVTSGADIFGNSVIKGSIKFYAPKGAGHFVFRLFDQSPINKAKMLETLGTSHDFYVELFDVDVTNNLKHSVELFEDKQDSRALIQLISTVTGIRTSGRSLGKDQPSIILEQCMSYIFDWINTTMITMWNLFVKNQKLCVEESSRAIGSHEIQPTIWSNRLLNEDDLSTLRSSIKAQADIHELLSVLLDNQIAFKMLSRQSQRDVQNYVTRLCPITNRFFKTTEEITSVRLAEYGFIPAIPQSVTPIVTNYAKKPVEFRFSGEPSTNPLDQLKALFDKAIPALVPANSFVTERLNICRRIEIELLQREALPIGSTLLLYGSSMNNFGTEEADLDICISFPKSVQLKPENKGKFMELLGQVLEEIGMTEVKVRSTARIPIVNFRDAISGKECDIAFYNPLAVSNTRLLRTYSICDPRIRPLAYVIKRWAKCRMINSPSEGTLGSYAYILTLIHFLQSRPTPVLPNLQKLHPTWRGERIEPGLLAPASLPHEHELHPVENIPCETYFYSPLSNDINGSMADSPSDQLRLLLDFGSQNHESLVELLLGYFRYYAWEFNYKQHAVSIQGLRKKQDKAEHCGWNMHSRISIEDPFETWYDVAHIVKGPQMMYIRKEFLRAYTILARGLTGSNLPTPRVINLEGVTVDSFQEEEVPKTIPPNLVLPLLFENGAPPPFSEVAKQARRDSVVSHDNEDLLE